MPTRFVPKSIDRRRFAAAAALLAFVGLSHVVADAATTPFETLTIDTSAGSFAFTIEIADTEAARQKGLMFRKHLDADKGMLFDYGQPRPPAFWMKNTYISLDMIFIRADGTVAGFAENTVPLSEDIISMREPVKAVLEVPAGTVKRLLLKVGDHIRHRVFGN